MEKKYFSELNKLNNDINHFKVHYDEVCMVCNKNTSPELIGHVSEHEYSNTTSLIFPVYRCPQCQLTYLCPRPDVSELKTIYPSDYYTYHLSANMQDASASKKSFMNSILISLDKRSYCKRILPFITKQKAGPLRILDIGCGDGTQLNEMKNFFPGCETQGIDINKDAVETAQRSGHKVYCGRFEDMDLPSGYFDLVYSLHVIEHVERPDLFMDKCLNLLSQDGILLIETPNTDSLDYYMLKNKHWGGYHPPRHWYLFNIETFRHLAKRLNAEIVSFSTYNTGVFWNWSFHSICTTWLGKKIADKLFPPVTIFYGGFHPFIILNFFFILEKITSILLNKSNAMWIVFKKP